MVSSLSELCEYIGHISGNEGIASNSVDSHMVMLVLANICSGISVQQAKLVKGFFAVSFRNLFTKRDYAAEAMKLLEIYDVADGALCVVEEITEQITEEAEVIFPQISTTHKRQLDAMRDFFNAQCRATWQLKTIAEKLACKAKGDYYSIAEYNADVEQFNILENFCDQKTNKLEAILKGWG